MNDASKAIIRWLLLKENQKETEIEALLGALGRGSAKQEQDSIEMAANLVAAGRIAAQGTDQQENIERLFSLHQRLALIELEEKAADALTTVNTILENPPKSNLEAQIKSNLIRKTLAPFENVKA